MSVFIGSTTQSQRNCLSKEFKKLYAKKEFIPRKQKIAIALNTCDVGIKGIKDNEFVKIVRYGKGDYQDKVSYSYIQKRGDKWVVLTETTGEIIYVGKSKKEVIDWLRVTNQITNWD
jgi:uncharacterized protein with ATP-grasp and redox domains